MRSCCSGLGIEDFYGVESLVMLVKIFLLDFVCYEGVVVGNVPVHLVI